MMELATGRRGGKPRLQDLFCVSLTHRPMNKTEPLSNGEGF